MNRQSFVSILLAGSIALGAAAFIVPEAASAAEFTAVTPSTLKHNNFRYWRKKAEDAMLGSVGRKMTLAFSKNYFQRMQPAPPGIYKVTAGSRTTITSEKAKEWGVSAGISNVQGGVSHSSNYKGTITAYKMSIDLGNRKGDLRYETNRNHGHLQALKDEGDRGRLISAVWILVAGEEDKSECYSGDLMVNGDDEWKVSINASGCSSSSWTVAPGSIIAYEMVKVDKWNNEEITSKPKCPDSHPTYETRSSMVTPKDRCKKVTYNHVGVECKLAITDKADNWYVAAKDGRDVCKSKKGKPNKEVKCSKSGYDYVVQAGRDTCRKAEESYRDPDCPPGYDYDNKSTGNGGVDQCKLRGIAHLKTDNVEGF